MQLHKQQPSANYDALALQASERRRARSLLEMLSESGTDIRQGVNPQLAERKRFLQEQLNAKAQRRTQLMSEQAAGDKITAVAREIDMLTVDLENIEGQIRKASPQYAALKQPEISTVQEIQQLLDPESLLLEYSLGEERSYLWAVTSTSMTSYELPKKSDIQKAALQFYETLAAPSTGPTDAIQTGRSLSHLLLAPVASQLGRKRLVIVADGALQYLPFGALPDSTGSPTGYSPLIVKHEIANLPSIAVLATLRREVEGRKPAPKELAVIADPVFDAEDERVQKPSNQNSPRGQERVTLPTAIAFGELLRKVATETGAQRDGGTLTRLPGSRSEAERIAAFVPSSNNKKALDFDASRELVRSGELSNYRNLLFATHALVDNVHPELTAIVLSLVDETGKPVDGYLRAHEIYNLNLPADLVVLSSCETGLGKDVEGEGLVGLTRGFMYAGAARVVVSLWKVDDKATADLMVIFYRGVLKEGKRPADALRAAQVEMMKQARWRSPHYWSAFVLQGEWK
jgi:CHAT domain-containing protein